MKKYIKFLIVSAVMVFAVALIGCEECASGESKIITYQSNDDLAYFTGDSYTETFKLNTDKGTYDRYIKGTYRGRSYTTAGYGTLIESGSYTESSSGIRFSSEKGYDTSSGELVNLGVYDHFMARRSHSNV